MKDDLTDEYIGLLKACGQRSNCIFLYDKEKKETLYHDGDAEQPCFAHIPRVLEAQYKRVKEREIAFGIRIPTGHAAFYKAIMNRHGNPFAVMNDYDLVHIPQEGFIFQDVKKVPLRWLYNFCIFTRWPWEFADDIALYKRFIDQGVPHAHATWIAHNFYQAWDDPKKFTVSQNTNHKVFDLHSWDSVPRFVQGKPTPLPIHGSQAETIENLETKQVRIMEVSLMWYKPGTTYRYNYRNNDYEGLSKIESFTKFTLDEILTKMKTMENNL